ncbi:hypothetical protein AXF35_04475 [Legionella pneumophila subsp. pascullei]|nr:hypothetical protein AXF35_04475 [Legionella pneumophila subsp. pascullei]AMP93350.1 hypothetical protein AXF36_12315 [Legionella pneumophila subsp. pascullei]AMP96316.1 hypothetical protein AXF37_12205 [Legionella pneumophila subsp. pascullei]
MLLNQRILKKVAVFVNNRQVIHFSNFGVSLLQRKQEVFLGFIYAHSVINFVLSKLYYNGAKRV